MKEQVTVLGADTAIGGYVLYLLSKMGYRCKVPLRYPHRYSYLKFNDNVVVSQFNPLKPNELSLALKGSSKVFNFFRAYEVSQYDSKQLEYYNHFYCKHLIQLCAKNHVKHLIHHSTLGIDQLVIDNPYLLSRSYGEKAMFSNSSVQITIIRSSWVYGEGLMPNSLPSCFVKCISRDLQTKKLYPLIGKHIELAPIHIQDLAQLFISLLKPKSNKDKKRIEAMGADVLMLDDIVKQIHQLLNSSTKLYSYPLFLASRLVKKEKACGAFLPLGTNKFKLSLIPSNSTSSQNHNELYKAPQGILEYIKNNVPPSLNNVQYADYSELSPR